MTEVKIYDAYDIDHSEWRDLQSLARTAFRVDLMGQRSEDEIDALIGWHDPRQYAASHRDPNEELGKRYAANQEFRDPRLAVAKDAGDLVGFGYVASNVSGQTPDVRDHKYRTVLKRYAWVREIVVEPSHRREQIATKIGLTLLQDKTVSMLQPVSAYTWPDMFPHHQAALERLGFAATGSVQDNPFGEGHAPTTLTRMQARSVYGVSRRLRQRLH